MVLGQQQDSVQQCTTHSCCCDNDPTPAGMMISHIHRKGEWMISYKYMHMGMNGLINGSQNMDKNEVFANYLMAPEHMQMDMHMLMAMYGITHKLTLMGMLGYTKTSMEMAMFSSGGHHHAGADLGSGSHVMETSGPADIKLYALYSPLNKSHHQLVLSAGMSFPVAGTTEKGEADDMMYPDKRLPYAMQPGSGTYDVLPCVNYLYQQGKITASAQLSATIRTGHNATGYRLGNETILNGWFAYQWLNFLSSSLRVEGVQSGEISGNDPTLYIYSEPSANPANYGGKRVNCYIGSVVKLKKGFLSNTGLGIEYGVPVYQYWNGTQMKLQQSLNVSLSVGF
jgi:hypothetical protein